MTALKVVRAAASRVNRAPSVLVGLWIVTLLAALPLMFVVRSEVVSHLGKSLEADQLASGANHDWMLEFAEQSSGVTATLTPSVLGFAATLDNLNALIEGGSRPDAILAVAAGSVLLWTFLSGGIIDRFARDRATGTHAFFQACGGYLWPLVRLGVVSAIVYGALLASWRPWLLGTAYDRLTREVSAERTAFAIRLALLAAVFIPVVICRLIFDYAKVRLVIEDRLSAFGALRAALGFVGRNWRGALIVFLCDMAVLALVLLVYFAIAPGAGSTGVSMWLGLIVGQSYLLARIWAKLLFWASAVEWFQHQLAHVGYTSRRAPRWPEPAIVEQIVQPVSPDAAR